jgi:hypothetical protein
MLGDPQLIRTKQEPPQANRRPVRRQGPSRQHQSERNQKFIYKFTRKDRSDGLSSEASINDSERSASNEERRPPPRKDDVPFLPYRNPHLRNSGKIFLAPACAEVSLEYGPAKEE